MLNHQNLMLAHVIKRLMISGYSNSICISNFSHSSRPRRWLLSCLSSRTQHFLGGNLHQHGRSSSVHYESNLNPFIADYLARTKFCHLAQTSSLSAYITDFTKLELEIVSLTPEDKLHHFVKGLHPTLWRDV